MTMELVATVRERIREVVTTFVAAQRIEGDVNNETFRIGRAAAALGPGWSVSNIRIAMGRKVPKRPDQLPQSAALLQLCAIADVNAEWLFTGTGPQRRSVARVGGSLTTEQLGYQFTMSMLPDVAKVYGCTVEDLELDCCEVLQTAAEMVMAQVREDAIAYNHAQARHQISVILGDWMKGGAHPTEFVPKMISSSMECFTLLDDKAREWVSPNGNTVPIQPRHVTDLGHERTEAEARLKLHR